MARMLVIDDEHNIRMMVRLALQHSGHTVETASEGESGLEKFRREPGWDLILLDQRMPGMEGLTVLKQIRYHDASVPVIMITAFGTIDLAVEVMKTGASDFLRKPFTADTLRRAVQAALQKPIARTTPSELQAETPPLTFGMTTINGYRIEFDPRTGTKTGQGMECAFRVQHSEGAIVSCKVRISILVMELVKAHVDCETLPGGNRFWQALCEEALANYLYQNAVFPPDGVLCVDELTPGLRRFIDTVLVSG